MTKSQYKLGDEPWVIRKHGCFYRTDFCGYTNHIEAAGIYTMDEAKSEAAFEPKNILALCLSHFRAEAERNRDMAQAMIDKINAIFPVATGKGRAEMAMEALDRIEQLSLIFEQEASFSTKGIWHEVSVCRQYIAVLAAERDGWKSTTLQEKDLAEKATAAGYRILEENNTLKEMLGRAEWWISTKKDGGEMSKAIRSVLNKEAKP